MSLLDPVVADDDVRVYHGDSLEVLAALPPHFADAIVTSPPYAGQRGAVAPEEYADWIEPFLDLMLRALRPHGSLMLNLGRTFRDGEESSYIEETLFRARSYGWRRLDTIIWRKLNAHPFVAPCYLINEHEIVYWLGASTDAYRGYNAETRRPPSAETLARRARGGLRGPKNRERGGYVPAQRTDFNPDGVRPGSVFESAIGRNRDVQHGEAMEAQLAEHLVCLACPPRICDVCGPLTGTRCDHSPTRHRQGLVLDPFCGSGTTLRAARARGRMAVGIDIADTAVQESSLRLAQQALPLPA